MFVFNLPKIKLTFPQVQSVLPMMVSGGRSPCPYPDLRKFFTSYPSALLRSGNERAAGWVLADSQGKATTAIKKIFSHLTLNLRRTPQTGGAGVSPQRCLLLVVVQETGWEMELRWLLQSAGGVGWVWICSANLLFVSFPPLRSTASSQPSMLRFQPRRGLHQLPRGR